MRVPILVLTRAAGEMEQHPNGIEGDRKKGQFQGKIPIDGTVSRGNRNYRRQIELPSNYSLDRSLREA